MSSKFESVISSDDDSTGGNKSEDDNVRMSNLYNSRYYMSDDDMSEGDANNELITTDLDEEDDDMNVADMKVDDDDDDDNGDDDGDDEGDDEGDEGDDEGDEGDETNILTALKTVHSRICDEKKARNEELVDKLLEIWKSFITEENTLNEINQLPPCVQINSLMNEITISNNLQETLESEELMNKVLRGIEWLATAYDYFLLYTILYIINFSMTQKEIETHLPTDLAKLTTNYADDAVKKKKMDELLEKKKDFEILYCVEKNILHDENGKNELKQLMKNSERYIDGVVTFPKLVHYYRRPDANFDVLNLTKLGKFRDLIWKFTPERLRSTTVAWI